MTGRFADVSLPFFCIPGVEEDVTDDGKKRGKGGVISVVYLLTLSFALFLSCVE